MCARKSMIFEDRSIFLFSSVLYIVLDTVPCGHEVERADVSAVWRLCNVSLFVMNSPSVLIELLG